MVEIRRLFFWEKKIKNVQKFQNIGLVEFWYKYDIALSQSDFLS